MLYWFSPKTSRRLLLLLASYLFYMSWLPVYGILIFFLSICNYLLGLAIDRRGKNTKALFISGLCFNLGMLCYFKYTNFFISTFNEFSACGSTLLHKSEIFSLPTINIILPLGISFFVFEFIHYLTDVYKGDKAIKNPIDFGLFAAFFPSQIAGPIKRYQDFVAQLGNAEVFDGHLFHTGLVLVLQGLFKKIALADNLAPLANAGFAGSSNLGTIDAWIAAVAFALQIYFDFSGYTDIGRGSAKMLGFSLPDNFNFPYLASSLSDFWKRWHISLSSWLRDYLYIPLGGGRCSRLSKSRNLMITMLLGGLWHGAAWHFVIWGGLHGAGLIINHSYDDLVRKFAFLQKLHMHTAGKCFSTIVTFLFVLTAWVFFRADNAHIALEVLGSMLTPARSSSVLELYLQSPINVAFGLYGAYALLFSLDNYRCFTFTTALRQKLRLALPTRVLVYASAFLAALGFCPSNPSPFIYFQF